MAIQKNDAFFLLGLMAAIWFALTSWLWAYWAALVISYPFGLISYFLWQKIQAENRQRNRFIPIILGLGVLSSVITLACLLIWG